MSHDTTVATPITVETALTEAARLLRTVEMETDRGLMERYEKLADSWSNIAAILAAREQAA